MLEKFVEKLSDELALETPLEPDAEGTYSLHLEPNLHISLRENGKGCITLQTSVAPLPEEGREEYLLKAMSANLFGRETGGSMLGLNRDGRHVVLVNILSEDADYRVFHETIEDFVNYAEAWRTETIEFVG